MPSCAFAAIRKLRDRAHDTHDPSAGAVGQSRDHEGKDLFGCPGKTAARHAQLGEPRGDLVPDGLARGLCLVWPPIHFVAGATASKAPTRCLVELAHARAGTCDRHDKTYLLGAKAASIASNPSVNAAGPGCRMSGDFISTIRLSRTA